MLLLIGSIHGSFYRFQYNDDLIGDSNKKNNNYDINDLPTNKSITIKKLHNINYHQNMKSLLHDCSSIRAYPSNELIGVKYKICKKWIHGNVFRYKVIPAYDMSDLTTNNTYHQAHMKVAKVQPFASHLLILGNNCTVALSLSINHMYYYYCRLGLQ